MRETMHVPTSVYNYVDGEWTESGTGETFEVRNPANPDEIVARFQQSNSEDARWAVEAAVDAQDKWAETPGPRRGSILNEAAKLLEDCKDELTATLVREEGKTKPEAAGEVQRAVDIFYYHAQKAADFGGTVKQSSSPNTELYTKKAPMGVAGLITPWNYPIAIPAWKLAPALAAGNSVVFKPATLAPTVGYEIIDALDEAGIPDGVVNMVTGPGSEVGDVFTTHDEIDAVSFTGSSTVGKHVYEQAADGGKRVQCEMGGKNPTVVMPSADLDEAVDIVGSGAFGTTGQSCTACSRAIVHEDTYNEFRNRIVNYAESIEVGAGMEGAEMGPHVSEDELERTLEFIQIGQEQGAILETGGDQLSDEGYFVEPTVFSDVDPEARIAQEEIFGPVLSVIPVSSYREAIEVANDVDYGLSASIVTNDLSEADHFVDDVESGVVKVNEKTTGLELHVPFGGMKDSSTNTYREQGDHGLEFFSTTKTVYRSS